jgi:mevalonate kinase
MTQAPSSAVPSHPAASACGKVILLGEHAVVYGVPALCGALQGGAEVSAIPGSGSLRVPAWGVVTPPASELLAPAFRSPGELGAAVGESVTEAGAASPHPLGLAYRAILRAVLSPAQQRDDEFVVPYDFIARFAIPTGAGLGSSAALSVALVRALDQQLGLRLSAHQVDAAALAAEQVFHGHPSGLDHTIAQHGGFGLFRRGHGLTPLVGTPGLRLCIGHTGRARDTKGRVARVAELYREDEVLIGACFARIAALVDDAVAALRCADLPALGAAMSENQRELSRLEVSCPEIEEMCRLALQAGALGAKLTGGGGGGCVVALAGGREAEVRASWERSGFRSFLADIGPAGDDSAPGRSGSSAVPSTDPSFSWGDPPPNRSR